MLLAIGNLTCNDLPSSVTCWDDMKLKVKILARPKTYRAIAVFPQRCLSYNSEEMWREVDNKCVFEHLCSDGFRSELLHVLAPETVLVLITPFPILPPHGITLVTDVPECLLELWVNGYRVAEAEMILNYKLPTLFLGIRELLKDFVPDPLYFDLVLSQKFINWIKQQQKIIVNSTPWYVASLRYNIQRCTDFFKREEEKQEGGEELDDDEEGFSEPIRAPAGCPINTPCGCCPT